MSIKTPGTPASGTQHFVFVSYSHEDSAFVDQLVEDLQFAGVDTTYDKHILCAGDSLFEKLAPHLAKADAIIVVVSPASIRSQWVQAELGLAMASRFNERPIRVLPALISHCE